MRQTPLWIFLIFFMGWQEPEASSAYLPLDDPLYTALNLLHQNGFLADLNFSNQPFTRLEIVHSLDRVPDSALSPAERAMVKGLKKQMENGSRIPIARLSLMAGDTLSQTDSTRANWFASLSGTLESESFCAVLRARGEENYKTDPLYPWKKDRAAAVRFSDNYLKIDWPHFTAMLGRQNWKWGPFSGQSLILSPNAFSFDHLFLQFKLSRFTLSQAAGELERLEGHRRLASLHRLDIALPLQIRTGFFESIVYARNDQGGLRDYDLRYLNPFGVYFFEQMNNQNLDTDGNSLIGFDFEKNGKVGNARGQFLIDDIQVDNEDAGDQEPKQYGLMLGTDLFMPSPVLNRSRYLTVEFSKVTNRVYNVNSRIERYSYFGKGLGALGNDFEETRLWLTFFPKPLWISRTGLWIHRQGEGRIDAYWGNTSGGNLGFRSEKSPTGTVEQILRVYSEHLWNPYPNLGLRALAGYQTEKNIANVKNDDRQGIVLEIGIEARANRMFGL